MSCERQQMPTSAMLRPQKLPDSYSLNVAEKMVMPLLQQRRARLSDRQLHVKDPEINEEERDIVEPSADSVEWQL